MGGDTIKYDKTKAESLVALIASKTDIGKTKLMKLLYLMDFSYFEKYGKSITGAHYQNWPLGPVPVEVFCGLESSPPGCDYSTNIETRGTYDYLKIIPNGYLRSGIFSPEELIVIEDVLIRFKDMPQEELVKLTHNELPWMLTDPQEEIPYSYARYRSYKMCDDDAIKRLQNDSAYMDRVRQHSCEPSASTEHVAA